MADAMWHGKPWHDSMEHDGALTRNRGSLRTARMLSLETAPSGQLSSLPPRKYFSARRLRCRERTGEEGRGSTTGQREEWRLRETQGENRGRRRKKTKQRRRGRQSTQRRARQWSNNIENNRQDEGGGREVHRISVKSFTQET